MIATQGDPQKSIAPTVDFRKIIKEEKWSQLKIAKTHFTLNSIKRAAVRVTRQKIDEERDAIAVEE